MMNPNQAAQTWLHHLVFFVCLKVGVCDIFTQFVCQACD